MPEIEATTTETQCTHLSHVMDDPNTDHHAPGRPSRCLAVDEEMNVSSSF